MATNPSVTKRQKERNRQEKAREKDVKRKIRQENKPDRPANGEDPDIAGIIPGPQPVLEENL